jgi:hypothetical protein
MVVLHGKGARPGAQEEERATQEPVFSKAKAPPLRTKGPRPPSAGHPSSGPLTIGKSTQGDPPPQQGDEEQLPGRDESDARAGLLHGKGTALTDQRPSASEGRTSAFRSFGCPSSAGGQHRPGETARGAPRERRADEGRADRGRRRGPGRPGRRRGRASCEPACARAPGVTLSQRESSDALPRLSRRILAPGAASRGR